MFVKGSFFPGFIQHCTYPFAIDGTHSFGTNPQGDPTVFLGNVKFSFLKIQLKAMLRLIIGFGGPIPVKGFSSEYIVS